MKGITAFGIYLPYYRLKRETIFEAMGWFNPGIAALARGEKTVANYDEDSITMAIAAGINCLGDVDRKKIHALYLASTTLPNKERGNASIASGALNLSSNTRAAEFSGCLKSGTTALISALGGPDSEVALVCASDCRLGKAGGTQEQLFGDGAAAFMVGSDGVIASLVGHYSLSYDFADYRRMESDKFTRTWEERWIREAGHAKMIPEAINGLLTRCKLQISDMDKVVYPPLRMRDHMAIARGLGLESDKVQAPFLESIGNTGSAHPLLMLAAALEEAQAGDKILVASFGSGADALLFQVTEEIKSLKDRPQLKENLDYKRDLGNYTKYLSFKGMLPKEIGIRGEEVAPTSLSLSWREQNAVLRLAGSKCKACGTPQFPRERVCVNPDCGAVDQMEDYSFSDKKGRLFTYTADHLTYSEDPPAIYGIVDFEGGGRYWFDITDCQMESLEVGQAVQMTFRRRYVDEARGITGYFWKIMPFKR
ncbi:MAG: hydroxymethylglutaryl-CoA synthase family protein [Deltaproteobacteria bacterium]|nr:MAG: hydroxymethylglutaryl-CoA synthase family protein [Deltaproteobacteria bacterium]